jgi:hypothetical protein
VSNLLRALLSVFLPGAGNLLTSAYPLRIVQNDEALLVLNSNDREIVFNKRFRTVKSGTKVLAQFDAIQTIDVTHHRADDDKPESWSVRLNVKGWFASVTLGDTNDDAEASIVAARVSRFTDKRVRSL